MPPDRALLFFALSALIVTVIVVIARHLAKHDDPANR
jgi:hypothetical protein